MTDNLTPNRNAAVYPALVPMGHHAGKPPIPLSRPVMLVGSRASAHLHLISSTVSKAHALLIIADGRVYIRDLASRSHVIINDKAVREADLAAGDLLKIGSFSFKVRIPSAWKTPVRKSRSTPVQLAVDGDAFRLDERVALVGRRRTCDIALMEESVSTAHAVYLEMGGRRFVRDLGSRTGTFVNGQKIHQQEIRLGDKIRIGDTTFTMEAAPARPTGPVPVEAAAAAALMEPLLDDAPDLLIAEVQKELEQGLGTPDQADQAAADRDAAATQDDAAAKDARADRDAALPLELDLPSATGTAFDDASLVVDEPGPIAQAPLDSPIETFAQDPAATSAQSPQAEQSEPIHPVDDFFDLDLPESPSEVPLPLEPLPLESLPVDQPADTSSPESAAEVSESDFPAIKTPFVQPADELPLISPVEWSSSDVIAEDDLAVVDELAAQEELAPQEEAASLEDAAIPEDVASPGGVETSGQVVVPSDAAAPVESLDFAPPADLQDGTIFLETPAASTLPIGEQAVLDLLLESTAEAPTQAPAEATAQPPFEAPGEAPTETPSGASAQGAPVSTDLSGAPTAFDLDVPLVDPAVVSAVTLPDQDFPSIDQPTEASADEASVQEAAAWQEMAPSAAEEIAPAAQADETLPIESEALELETLETELEPEMPLASEDFPPPAFDLDAEVRLDDSDAQDTHMLPAIPADQSTKPPTLSAQIIEPSLDFADHAVDAVDLNQEELAEAPGDVNADTVAELELDSADTTPLPPPEVSGLAPMPPMPTSPVTGDLPPVRDQADRLRELARLAAQSPQAAIPPIQPRDLVPPVAGIASSSIAPPDEQDILELEPIDDSASPWDDQDFSPESATSVAPSPDATGLQDEAIHLPPAMPGEVQNALQDEVPATDSADVLSLDTNEAASPAPNLDLVGLDFLDDSIDPASAEVTTQPGLTDPIIEDSMAVLSPGGATDVTEAQAGIDDAGFATQGEDLKAFVPQSGLPADLQADADLDLPEEPALADELGETVAASEIAGQEAVHPLPPDEALIFTDVVIPETNPSVPVAEMDLESPVLPVVSPDAADANDLVPDDDLLNLAVEDLPDAPLAADVLNEVLQGEGSLDVPAEDMAGDSAESIAQDQSAESAIIEVIEPVEPTPESAQELSHAADLDLADDADLMPLTGEDSPDSLSDTSLGREVGALAEDSPEPIVEIASDHAAEESVDTEALHVEPIADDLPDFSLELPTDQADELSPLDESRPLDESLSDDLPEMDLGELQTLEPELDVELPEDAAGLLGDASAGSPAPADSTGEVSEQAGLPADDTSAEYEELPATDASSSPVAEAGSAPAMPPMPLGDVIAAPLPLPRPRLSGRRQYGQPEPVAQDTLGTADEAVIPAPSEVDVFSDFAIQGDAAGVFEIVIPEMDEPVADDLPLVDVMPAAEPATDEPSADVQTPDAQVIEDQESGQQMADDQASGELAADDLSPVEPATDQEGDGPSTAMDHGTHEVRGDEPLAHDAFVGEPVDEALGSGEQALGDVDLEPLSVDLPDELSVDELPADVQSTSLEPASIDQPPSQDLPELDFTDLPPLNLPPLDLPSLDHEVDVVVPEQADQPEDSALPGVTLPDESSATITPREADATDPDDLAIEPEVDLSSLDFLPPEEAGLDAAIGMDDLFSAADLDAGSPMPPVEGHDASDAAGDGTSDGLAEERDDSPQGFSPDAGEDELSGHMLLPVDNVLAGDMPVLPADEASDRPGATPSMPFDPGTENLPTLEDASFELPDEPATAANPLIDQPLVDEAPSEGEIVDESLSGHAPADGSTGDEVVDDQAAGDQTIGDLVTDEQATDDQVPHDEIPVGEIYTDEIPSGEISVNAITGDEITGDELSPDEIFNEEVPGEQSPEDQSPADITSGDQPPASPPENIAPVTPLPAAPRERAGPQVLFPTLPPQGHTQRSRRRFFNTPMLLLMMLILIGAAAGVIYGGYIPVSGQVSGRLKFANANVMSVRDQGIFWQRQWAVLLDDGKGTSTDAGISTRQAALAGLSRLDVEGSATAEVSPGFLGDAATYQKVVVTAQKNVPEDAVPDELIFSMDSDDPHDDALRVTALLKAVFTRDAHMVDEYNRIDGDLREAMRKQQAIQPQLLASRDKLNDLSRDSVPAVSEQELAALKDKVTTLETAIDQATRSIDDLMSQVRLLEIQASPAATQPAATVTINPEDDQQLKALQEQANALATQLDQQRTADVVVATQARRELDDAFKKLQDQLKQMQATGQDSPEMVAYVKVAKLIQSNAQDLTDQLIKSQTELNTGITNLKQKLEERMEQRRNELWANDSELSNLNQLLAYYERSVNAAKADANLLSADQVAQQQKALDDVRAKIAARREALARDTIFTQAAKDLQELIDANTKRLASDRQMVASKLTQMQKDLADAAPAIDHLPAEQKTMAEAMEKRLAELNAARLAYSRAIDTASAEQTPARQQLEQKLAAMRAQLDGRKQELAAQQQRVDAEKLQVQARQQLDGKRSSLAALQDQRKAQQVELAQLRTQLERQTYQRSHAVEAGALLDQLKRDIDDLNKQNLALTDQIQTLQAKKAAAVYPLPVDRDAVRADVANDPRHKYMVFSMVGVMGLFVPLMLISTLSSSRRRHALERAAVAARSESSRQVPAKVDEAITTTAIES